MTVREMLSRLDSRELSEWMAYSSIEPIGEYRNDLRFAMLTCTVTNLFKGAVGHKGKASKLDDFLLKFDPPKQQAANDMKAILRGLGR